MTLFFHDGQCLLKPYFVKSKLVKISENGKKVTQRKVEQDREDNTWKCRGEKTKNPELEVSKIDEYIQNIVA